MQLPKLLVQESNNHPDELACLVSFVPTFNADTVEKECEVVENEKPEEDEIVQFSD